MEEFERLVLAVESRGVTDANKALTTLERTATNAEAAVEDLTAATTAASAAATTAAATTKAEAAATVQATTATASETAAIVDNAAATIAAAEATAAGAAATAASVAATVAATEAEVAHTAAAVADAVAVVENATAQASNAAATATATVSTMAQVRAWIAARVAALAATTATAATTAGTALATAATAAYTLATRAAVGAMALLKGAATALYSQLALLLVPIAAVAVLVQATRSYQDFQAALKTATGTAQNATTAFTALQRFAATTPYSLDKSTESFIKLVNYGLTPSERALRSYGNTSSALNKDIVDMIEAVADAATGEFERLKEFGLLASKQGNEVTFTFRGVRTVVKNTAKDIEGYLIALGETNFATSMSDKMQTLGGAISNLGDAWDTMLSTLTRTSGLDNVFTRSAVAASNALTELTAQLASGQLNAEVEAMRIKWQGTFQAIVSGAGWVGGQLKEATTLWGLLGSTSSREFEEGWTHFPQVASAAFQTIINDGGLWLFKMSENANTVATAFDIAFKQVVGYARASGTAASTAFDITVAAAKETGSLIYGAFKVEFDRLLGYAKAVGAGIAEALKGSIPDLTGAFAKVDATATAASQALIKQQEALSKTLASAADLPATTNTLFGNVTAEADRNIAQAGELAKKRLDAAQAMHDATEQSIVDEYAKVSGQYDAKLAEADALRKKFDENAANAPAGDQLAQFSKATGATAPDPVDKGAASKAATQAKQMLAERLQFVEEGLLKEHEVYASSLQERTRMILENTTLTEQEKTALVLEAQMSSILTEEQGIQESYQRRHDIVMNSTLLTQQQKTEMELRLTENREKQLRDIEQQNQAHRLQQASEFFGNIASIGNTFGKKGFEIAKAAGIAQATIDTYKAATAAYSSLASIPYVGPALGAAAAAAAVVAGAANIAKIKSQTYSGAYEHGGMIPAGRFGVVGEAGPEFVRGPAVITSAKTTAAYGGGGGGGIRSITVNNNGAPVQAQASLNGDELLIMLKPHLDATRERTKRELTDGVRRGGDPFGKALEQGYGLSRGQGIGAPA